MYLLIVSELFLNSYVSGKICELNKFINSEGEALIPQTHTEIIDTIYDTVLVLQNQPYILYEFSYFIIRIAAAQV